jgi:hypothetical protein
MAGEKTMTKIIHLYRTIQSQKISRTLHKIAEQQESANLQEIYI